MARKRVISPEMFTSSTVSAWQPATRWTWAGLLVYLDDYGYGEDKPAIVKATVWPDDEVFPYSIADVAADLKRFVEAGSLCRFECCDKPQMHVPKWRDWQRVDHPAKPRFCVCPNHSRNAHEEHRKVSRERHESLAVIELNSTEENVSSPHAITDCLRPDLCHFHRARMDTA